MSADDARLEELLAPLTRVEPVRLHPTQRKRRRVLVAGLVTTALVAVGAAIAGGVNLFPGIGAAERPQTPQDELRSDPMAARMVRIIEEHMTAAGHGRYAPPELRPETARLLRELPGGRRVYVVAAASGLLCVIFTEGSIGCGPRLEPSRPTTIATVDVDGRGPGKRVSYGVAVDGVVSVSFRGGGKLRTVPVENNVWLYEGDAAVLKSLTVHYADGRTRVLSHGR